MTKVDIDELVREAQELRERLAQTATKLDAFTEALQVNVNRLREISEEMAEPLAEAQSESGLVDDPST
jgi:hypothetical protein